MPERATTPEEPLAALWRPPALLGVMLGGEALAAILALAPTQNGDRLVQFGLASLGIQWVALGTLCALYLLRHRLDRLPPMRLAWTCLGLFLAMSLLVSMAAWSILAMGGLATRKMLDDGSVRVDQVALLGTANRGTRFATLAEYIIERDIPGSGASTWAELQAISQQSCDVLRKLRLQL